MDRRCVLLISQWSALLWNILEDMKEPVCYIPSGICLGLGVTATAAVLNRPVCSGRQRDIKKAAAFFLIAAYAAIVLQLAFFSREPGSRKGVDLQLFGTWGNEILPHEYLVENILMFIPFGLLIPFAFPWAEKKKNCILSAFLFSICLELMQLVTERGFCQIDDVWTNTLGAWIGWMISRAIEGSEKGRNLQP